MCTRTCRRSAPSARSVELWELLRDSCRPPAVRMVRPTHGSTAPLRGRWISSLGPAWTVGGSTPARRPAPRCGPPPVRIDHRLDRRSASAGSCGAEGPLGLLDDSLDVMVPAASLEVSSVLVIDGWRGPVASFARRQAPSVAATARRQSALGLSNGSQLTAEHSCFLCRTDAGGSRCAGGPLVAR